MVLISRELFVGLDNVFLDKLGVSELRLGIIDLKTFVEKASIDMFRCEGLIHHGHIEAARKIFKRSKEEPIEYPKYAPETYMLCNIMLNRRLNIDHLALFHPLGEIQTSLAVLAAYTGLEEFLKYYLKAERREDTPLSAKYLDRAVMFDRVLWRFSMNDTLHFVIQYLEDLLTKKKCPKYIKNCVYSTLMAYYKYMGDYRKSKEYHDILMSNYDPDSDLIYNWRVDPTIARNLYLYGDKDLCWRILEKNAGAVEGIKLVSKISPYISMPSREIIDLLQGFLMESYTFLMGIYGTFYSFNRYRSFGDHLKVIDILEKIYGETYDPLAKILIAFFDRKNLKQHIAEIFEHPLIAEETPVLFFHLGTLYIHIYREARRLFEEKLSKVKSRVALQAFINGIYDETIKLSYMKTQRE